MSGLRAFGQLRQDTMEDINTGRDPFYQTRTKSAKSETMKSENAGGEHEVARTLEQTQKDQNGNDAAESDLAGLTNQSASSDLETYASNSNAKLESTATPVGEGVSKQKRGWIWQSPFHRQNIDAYRGVWIPMEKLQTSSSTHSQQHLLGHWQDAESSGSSVVHFLGAASGPSQACVEPNVVADDSSENLDNELVLGVVANVNRKGQVPVAETGNHTRREDWDGVGIEPTNSHIERKDGPPTRLMPGDLDGDVVGQMQASPLPPVLNASSFLDFNDADVQGFTDADAVV